MKNRIAAAVALAFSTFAPLGSAATYVYTFNDMTYVPDQAWNTVNTAAYWENRGTDRWGFVWTTPLTFSTSFPSGGGGGHFHIGYKGQYECFVNTQPGHFVNNVCVANDVWTNRGPFVTHSATSTLFFQLVTNSSVMVPFVAKKIDVYNAANESINVYVRKQTDGNWFYWGPLHGYLDGEPNWFRWTLNSGYTGKFSAMAWKSVSGAFYSSSVGRVEITD